MDNENPTIGEAFESASSSLQAQESPEEPSSQETKPDVTEEEPSSESEQTESTQAEAESTAETPLDKFNPDELPEELKPLYKNLMKGFTQGRQQDRAEVAELKKQLTALQPKEEQPDPQADPERYAEWLADKKVTERQVNEFRKTAVSEYGKLDKRLDSTEGNESYDEKMDVVIGAQLDKLLDDHLQEGGKEWEFDYKAAGKQLIESWDKYLQQYATQYLTKQKDLAKRKSQTLQKSNPKKSGSDANPSGTMSLEDAMTQAYAKLNS